MAGDGDEVETRSDQCSRSGARCSGCSASNFSQVVVAGTVGMLADSTGLLGAALDNLGDAAVYGVSSLRRRPCGSSEGARRTPFRRTSDRPWTGITDRSSPAIICRGGTDRLGHDHHRAGERSDQPAMLAIAAGAP